VDLYARSGDGTWQFVGNGRPGKAEGNVTAFELPEDGPTPLECMLYLPLYNRAVSVEVGVTPGALLEPGPPRPADRSRPVVIYGTSITQGGCASRPGMVWTSILGRLLDRPVINLGFSGSGRMEPPVGELLAELDPVLYLIDCTWNMGDGQEVYTERISRLVASIRAVRPDTPILFAGQSHMRPEAHPTDLTTRQENAVRALQEEGVAGLYLVPGDDLIGHDGEGTVDGVHLTDLGMERQARALLPVVSEIIGALPKP
jgi:hypothetical protein